MVSSAFCLLALAAQPDPAALLARAGMHEVDLAQCADAMDTYVRFFDACASCDLYAYGQQRFDVAVDRCTTATKKADTAVYEPGVDANPADATQLELFELARKVLEIDQKAAAELLAAAHRVGPNAEAPAYNELRLRAFEVLQRREPTPADVEQFIRRLNTTDFAFSNALKATLSARTPPSAETLRNIRKHVLEMLVERSTAKPPAPAQEPVEGACKLDPDADPGFLTITSKPWGEVFVNGRRVGETPLSRVKVASGCAEIRVVDPATGKERVEAMEIKPNRVQIVTINVD